MEGGKDHTSKLLRLLGHVIAKGEDHTPMALNEDGTWLALIGPHNFTITILAAESLDEIMRIDITPATRRNNQSDPFMDSAKLVFFSPLSLNQVLVVTKGSQLLKFSASNGQLLSEVGHVHRKECSTAQASRSGRYLLTAGDQVLKLWDYSMALDINFQVCACMYMCVHVCTCVYMCVRVCTCMYMCVHVCTCVCIVCS